LLKGEFLERFLKDKEVQEDGFLKDKEVLEEHTEGQEEHAEVLEVRVAKKGKK
jgi:hypothetical protein